MRVLRCPALAQKHQGQGSHVFYEVRSPYEVAKRPEGPGSYVFYEVLSSLRSPRGQILRILRGLQLRRGSDSRGTHRRHRKGVTLRRRVKGSYSEGRTPRLRMGPDEGMPPQA